MYLHPHPFHVPTSQHCPSLGVSYSPWIISEYVITETGMCQPYRQRKEKKSIGTLTLAFIRTYWSECQGVDVPVVVNGFFFLEPCLQIHPSSTDDTRSALCRGYHYTTSNYWYYVSFNVITTHWLTTLYTNHSTDSVHHMAAPPPSLPYLPSLILWKYYTKCWDVKIWIWPNFTIVHNYYLGWYLVLQQ
jgi:hypothetical protein